MLVRESTVVCWDDGKATAVGCRITDEGHRLALMWLGHGYAVAAGVTDEVTAECEGLAYGDGGGAVGREQIVSLCRHAQGVAWLAWRRQASPEVLEIAQALSPHWTLDTAALAETAELLAAAPVTAPRA